MPYIVYILQSAKDNRYYIGQTTNLQQRIAKHNKCRVKSTKARIPWKLIHYETFASRKKAIRREHEIKARKSRAYIESMITQK